MISVLSIVFIYVCLIFIVCIVQCLCFTRSINQMQASQPEERGSFAWGLIQVQSYACADIEKKYILCMCIFIYTVSSHYVAPRYHT